MERGDPAPCRSAGCRDAAAAVGCCIPRAELARSQVMLDAPPGRDIAYWGRGDGHGCTHTGEGMGVRAYSVGRFSPCCFLAGTSPAEDAAGRDAWLGAGRHGAQGEGALLPSRRAAGRHVRMGSIWQVIQCQMGICFHCASPQRAHAALRARSRAALGGAAGCPRGTAPKSPLGAQGRRTGQGAGGTARQPCAAVQKRPAEHGQRRSDPRATSCARALRARSRLRTPAPA